MSLIVQKFGGTSVADAHHINNVAKIITNLYSKGNDIIVVVSAQGDTTDDFLNLASQVNKNPSKREMDALISAGEQISSSLLAMAIQNLGVPAISLTGWQAGFKTNSDHGNAKIEKIITDRIESEIGKKNIVIVAGFQGIDENQNITTLGRGGSDTSAVAIAAEMNADICKIYTDVDGVYTADPRVVPSAKKLKTISYSEMFELSCHGAQVLNERSIETAKKCGVEVEVLSSMASSKSGTLVKDIPMKNNNLISGIAVINHLVKITITNIQDKFFFQNSILPNLKLAGICIDELLVPTGQKTENAATFAVPDSNLNETIKIIEKFTKQDENIQIFYDKEKSKISAINLSNNININIASLIFETLAESKINIDMVGCSNTRVSVLLNSSDMHSAVNSIHSKLFEEDNLI